MEFSRRKFTALLALVPSVAAASKMVPERKKNWVEHLKTDIEDLQPVGRMADTAFQERYRAEYLAGFSKVRSLSIKAQP